jgi:hypothetical protein
MVQPYPVHSDGSAGLLAAVLSPTADHREAVVAWCREHLEGWWKLRKLGAPLRGHTLWECEVPLSPKRYRFVVNRA